MKQTTQEWINSAASDLLVIEKIIDSPDLTHLLAFHAQQAIEKGLKALIEEAELKVIKTHSLSYLLNKVEKQYTLEYNEDTINTLDQLYIDARYPGDLGLLPNGKPGLDDAKTYYLQAKSIISQIEELLQ
jgi:HEPN domain-containing protein